MNIYACYYVNIFQCESYNNVDKARKTYEFNDLIFLMTFYSCE